MTAGGPRIGIPSPLPPYIKKWSWTKRRSEVLKQANDWAFGKFSAANAKSVEAMASAKGKNARLHVIFNIGSDALRSYAQTGDYKNAYEQPTIVGATVNASPTRQHVDELIGLKNPESFYFCALSSGGVGIRFYGEYCVVLKSGSDSGVKRVLDRNSYDFIRSPLKELLAHRALTEKQDLVKRLETGFRSKEMGQMLAIKVLQHFNHPSRLLTMGSISEAILADEDYVEALHEGKIPLQSVLEVRSSPLDEMQESGILSKLGRGQATVEELLWVSRREEVRKALAAPCTGVALELRTVVGAGRSGRWK